MSSVWKRFQRINKKAAKFQFTASFHELALHLTPKWQPQKLEVVWQRRNRRVVTAVPEWEPGMREPLEGVCVWTVPANTVITVTLFRDNRTNRYEDKEWTFVIEDVSGTGKRRQVATAVLNMTQYAGLCQHDLRVSLRPLSRKLVSASLELTLSCLLLREGKATDEDMQSLASLMSMNAPNDIAPLDDLEEDDEEGRCAEISNLAAQISSLTCSLHEDDPASRSLSKGRGDSPAGVPTSPPHIPVRSPSLTPTLTPSHYSDAPEVVLKEQDGDNATLEGDVVKECGVLSPDDQPCSTDLPVPCDAKPSEAAEVSAAALLQEPGSGTIEDTTGEVKDETCEEGDRRRTLQDRQALRPLELTSGSADASPQDSAPGSCVPPATPGQDLVTWCQQAVAGHRGVRITNMTTSWRSGLAFCALIHAFRPDLIDYDSLSPQDVIGNCRAAFEAGEKLGVARLIEPQDMVLRAVPDKLAVITYLYQLRAHFTGHELEVAQLGDTTAQSSYTVARPPDASPAAALPASPPAQETRVDATTALYNDRNTRLSSKSGAEAEVSDVINDTAPAAKISRHSSVSSQDSVKSGGSSASAKDRLLASSKSLTSEIFKLGNKVLSPTAHKEVKADKRNSTGSMGAPGGGGAERQHLMTRRQLMDPFASDEEDDDLNNRCSATADNDPSSPAATIVYQSGAGTAKNKTTGADSVIHLDDVKVPGLLDLSPVSPTQALNTRSSAGARHTKGRASSPNSLDPPNTGGSTAVSNAALYNARSSPPAPELTSTKVNMTSPGALPTSFNTPPVTPLAPEQQQQHRDEALDTRSKLQSPPDAAAVLDRLREEATSPVGSKTRGSSRHEELKERARLLLEAARRDAASAADDATTRVGPGERSLSKEEEERQLTLRERARRLIAEAKQGVVSPPRSLTSPVRPSAGSPPLRHQRSEERVPESGVVIISSKGTDGKLEPSLSSSPATNIDSARANGSTSPTASDAEASACPPSPATSSSATNLVSEDQGEPGSQRTSVRAIQLQSFSNIIDRMSPEKEAAATPPVSEKAQTAGRERSQYLTGELLALEREQEQIDAQAAKLEKKLRRVMEAGNRAAEEERLMQRWFTLVNKKNALIRRQEQLSILEKESNLERRFELLNRELRAILAIEDHQKTEVQQRQESLLLDELVQIVNMRNELVNHLDSQEKMLDDDQRIAQDVSRASVKATQEKCLVM